MTYIPKQVPSGAIVIWSGAITDIPEGWVLCDGNNGTPNLLDKFVKCVPDSSTNPGATGGSISKTTSGHRHGKGDLTGGLETIVDGGHWTSTNTDTIADIRPPYYEVAFIMKL